MHAPDIRCSYFSTAKHPVAELIVDLKLMKLSAPGQVMYWNWNLAPEDPLTSDFIFMPEVWGSGVVSLDCI